jgi:hypothetical protein
MRKKFKFFVCLGCRQGWVHLLRVPKFCPLCKGIMVWNGRIITKAEIDECQRNAIKN